MDFVDCVMVPDGEAGSGMTFLYTDAHDNIIYIYICIICICCIYNTYLIYTYNIYIYIYILSVI